MKKLAKIMAVFAAIMMALAFAGCKSDDDDDDSTVAVYKAAYTSGGMQCTYLLTFYDDNTFVVRGNAGEFEGTVMTGTYTGDPSKDGTIALSVKKFMDDDTGELLDADDDTKEEINGDYIVKDGKFALLGGLEFTRQ
ncbi:hypothetical protein [Treponema sp.]|uniref:hypothetical protein n=1 Tax=Treponema sp. TaxID=166 RepID=UPI003F0C7595